jgi:hypothetical protein
LRAGRKNADGLQGDDGRTGTNPTATSTPFETHHEVLLFDDCIANDLFAGPFCFVSRPLVGLDHWLSKAQ